MRADSRITGIVFVWSRSLRPHTPHDTHTPLNLHVYARVCGACVNGLCVPELLEKAETVETRHHHIGQHEVDVHVLHHMQSLQTCFAQFVT